MANEGTSPKIPTIQLSHGGVSMPVLGLGMAPNPPVPDEVTKNAVIDAVEVGYRHFDTATIYFTEKALGEGITQVLNCGMVKSREELFITSKLWVSDAHPNLVVPALKTTLKNMKLEYLDLYLIHWAVSAKPGPPVYPIKQEDFLPFDLKGVWTAMEECQRLGLAKAIGVSNFTQKKLQQLLTIATIPPAVNQVEVNPTWQQKELINFCKSKHILVTAYSPLGGPLGGHNGVMESNILKEIAKAKGKTVAQVALRWGYEQGIAVVVKSFNKDRMKQNLGIFDWELTSDEHEKIRSIPQGRTCDGSDYTSPLGPICTIEELWDGEI
ncbi:non-functional NADPH-dependent codeinone reductase 2 [Beta vulgaris subsp. vulgaris]|uniref:non-functional NADPH-dependent codeinone reductase 2 n=1 Tax=Beta vulgaris subsp. vulgaris TaxID=3555 RepID=UPI002036C103|nr:non-functional NADPH-dependent codeinone reductase 2 [Beta vulgaris subsp. vulgaris]